MLRSFPIRVLVVSAESVFNNKYSIPNAISSQIKLNRCMIERSEIGSNDMRCDDQNSFAVDGCEGVLCAHRSGLNQHANDFEFKRFSDPEATSIEKVSRHSLSCNFVLACSSDITHA